MRIFIAGGGTGGHLTPAIALAAEFSRRGIEPTLIVGARDVDMLPKGLAHHTLIVRARYGFIGKVRHVLELIISFFQSVSYIVYARPSAVIGVGGYLSVPPIIAGVLFRVPIFICEQNSIPGKANRFLALFARGVYHSFNKSMEYVAKGIVTGNPVRADFYHMTKRRARKALAIPVNARVLLVTGGSQGAKRLNEIFLDAYPLLSRRDTRVRVLWVTGRGNYDVIANEVSRRKLSGITLFAFHAQMHMLVHAADCALSRSGSSTVSEFMVASLPAVFVPFPHATDDHQYYNAKEMADLSHADILREETLTAEDLASALSHRMRMPRRASAEHDEPATRTIVNDIVRALSLPVRRTR
ncbi:MAG: UDP-N-acetylglucosamine--N-acetylmuramyl-(pentapeptide) pyrophosphoryl-undecaprenol N-acetylglucosamine transferase [Spirochaetota bacterium]